MLTDFYITLGENIMRKSLITKILIFSFGLSTSVFAGDAGKQKGPTRTSLGCAVGSLWASRAAGYGSGSPSPRGRGVHEKLAAR